MHTLQVREDAETGLGVRAAVWHARVAREVLELVITSPGDGWSGYVGVGVLPTGHPLTVTIGPY